MTPLSDLSLRPAAFYRADLRFAAASGVWGDLSGNARDTTPQSATRPSAGSGINGKPTVSFAGSASQALVVPATSFGTFSIHTVVKLTGTAGYIAVTKDDGGADGGYLFGSTGQTINVHKNTTAICSLNLSSNWAVDNAAKSIVWVFGGNLATHKLYVNGVDQTLSTVTNNGDASGSVSQAVYIGASDTGTAATTGHYGEFALYHGALTAADVAKLAAYDRAFWGTP